VYLVPATKVLGDFTEDETPVITKGAEGLPEGKKAPRKFFY
jgi:hypothetical protein